MTMTMMMMMMITATDADDFVDDANDDDDDAYVLVLRSRNPAALEWPWRLHLVSTKHLPFSFFNS